MAFMRDPLYILMQDEEVKVYDSLGIKGFNAFGTWPQDLFDMVVMMRYYNMTEEERRAAICRALKTQFETGSDGVRKASGLPTVMERVDTEIERSRTAGYGGSM